MEKMEPQSGRVKGFGLNGVEVKGFYFLNVYYS